MSAEPAVHVLNRQVEDHRRSYSRQRHECGTLHRRVLVSLALAMIRVLTGISIMWFLIPAMC